MVYRSKGVSYLGMCGSNSGYRASAQLSLSTGCSIGIACVVPASHRRTLTVAIDITPTVPRAKVGHRHRSDVVERLGAAHEAFTVNVRLKLDHWCPGGLPERCIPSERSPGAEQGPEELRRGVEPPGKRSPTRRSSFGARSQ